MLMITLMSGSDSVSSVHGDRHGKCVGHHRHLLSSGRHDNRQVLRAVPGDVDVGRASCTSSVERHRHAAAERRPRCCHVRLHQPRTVDVSRCGLSTRPRYTHSNRRHVWQLICWAVTRLQTHQRTTCAQWRSYDLGGPWANISFPLHFATVTDTL